MALSPRAEPSSDPTVAATGVPGARGTRSSALGDFLKARRARTDPGSVNIVMDQRRRQVHGLRREELADLAGISTDYYTRLEQGRERRPSTQVLESLARALRLNDNESGHLFRLAGLAAPEPVPASELGTHLRTLLGSPLLRIPVMVIGPSLDIVDLNPVAAALYDGFSRTENLLHMVFRDPAARAFFGEWHATARTAVARLRASSAQFPDDPRITDTAAQLSRSSTDFAALWAQHELRPSPLPTDQLMRHPVVGDLHLYCSTFEIVSAPGQHMLVFTPQPGSQSARRIEQLPLPPGRS
ncbi:helix-turn-helix transcriptional regulator [Streptomyces sp. SL13]|uniref:Helix-turn-helix transcriptional regulator n=1 Tax=Streptantibioticus silvisoli TaxID=2705255 RepID=A0AA90H8Z2_9ACTN|nr:helix-turn-helix transcriptional regulator [Streptantibioticus silvisoli]MDI5973396.1 helix-turn-helix transcriptional regulator [Streptantibioticus silvisoli]